MALVKYSRFWFSARALPHAKNDYKQISAFDARALPDKKKKPTNWWADDLRKSTNGLLKNEFVQLTPAPERNEIWTNREKHLLAARVQFINYTPCCAELTATPYKQKATTQNAFRSHLASILFQLVAHLLFSMLSMPPTFRVLKWVDWAIHVWAQKIAYHKYSPRLETKLEYNLLKLELYFVSELKISEMKCFRYYFVTVDNI